MPGIYDAIGKNGFSVHLFGAALSAVSEGDVTPDQVITEVNSKLDAPLDSQAETEYRQMMTDLMALTDAGEKALFIIKAEAYPMLREQKIGSLTKDKFETRLGIKAAPKAKE